jgi:hypothetical protein
MNAHLIGLILLGSTAQVAASERPRVLFLLPDGFSGWACVDFGVESAPPLPRERETLVIRVRPGGVPRTSNSARDMPPLGEARIESGGKWLPLPGGLRARKSSGMAIFKSPVERQCVFFGSKDAAAAAGDPPAKKAGGVPPTERQALLALYAATQGEHWEERVGWGGPPGTECSWHGVSCEFSLAEPTFVTGLHLYANNLSGAIPSDLEQLTKLDELYLFDNHLQGRLPESLLQRWAAGSLEVNGDASLFTGVSEIEYESSLVGLLCESHRILLRADETARSYSKRCRLTTPEDRETFCEIKSGRIPPWEFGRLAYSLERGGFFRLETNYERLVTHGNDDTIRVTRDGVTREVHNYATAGPIELWSAQRAIEGAAAVVEWEQTTTAPHCPERQETQ